MEGESKYIIEYTMITTNTSQPVKQKAKAQQNQTSSSTHDPSIPILINPRPSKTSTLMSHPTTKEKKWFVFVMVVAAL